MPNKWHMFKEGQAGIKIDNCLCFLNYLAFLRPAADRAVSVLPWVVSPGRSYGYLWAGSIIQKTVRKDNPTPAFSPVSDRRRLTARVEVHWAQRVQAPMPQISRPNLQENHIIETCKEEGCAVSTQETAAWRKWELASKHLDYVRTSKSIAKAMQTRRIFRAWGHSFARGFARVILDRVRGNLDQAPDSRNWGSELDADAEFNFFNPLSVGRSRS
jgi:hypothetical protein